MAIKRKQSKTYLQMFEDYKKKNSRKKTIKVKYLTNEDFYVMSKEELKTIKQMYDPSDPMRKDFKMDLFLSEKGQLFRILEDGNLYAYSFYILRNRKKYHKQNLFRTGKSKKADERNFSDYQLTNIVFNGNRTPKANEIMNKNGMDSLKHVPDNDLPNQEKRKKYKRNVLALNDNKEDIQVHHQEEGRGADPQETLAITRHSHDIIEEQNEDDIKLHSETKTLEGIKEQLKLTQVLSEETMGKPYMAIQKTETDKAKFIILEEKDTKEVEKELVSLLWQGIQQADQDLKKSFIEHIQQQSDQQGFESVNQYLQKLASDENTNVTQEFLNDQYLKYVKDHKQER